MKIRHPIKLILMIDVVVVIYILLTSTIIQVRSEHRVADILIDTVKDWSPRYVSSQEQVMRRERGLVAEVDEALSQRLSGRILLQVESRGEAWYVYPDDLKKYYLGRPSDILKLINKLAVFLENETIIQYLYFDKIFPGYLAGKFVIDKDNKNDFYYVDPRTKKGYLLTFPDSMLKVAQELGAGISNQDLHKIGVGESDG